MQNFKLLASKVPVERLLSAIESQPELWGEITARQDTPGSAHKYTEAIFLRWCETKTVAAAFTEIPAVDYKAYSKLPEARELVEFVESLVGSKELGRVLVVKLKSGGEIFPHPDEGQYADHYERFHVSLKSDQGNLFFSGEPGKAFEAVHMEPGEIWWFNHKRVHWVVNSSVNPRIHLIIDCVAPKYRRPRDA